MNGPRRRFDATEESTIFSVPGRPRITKHPPRPPGKEESDTGEIFDGKKSLGEFFW